MYRLNVSLIIDCDLKIDVVTHHAKSKLTCYFRVYKNDRLYPVVYHPEAREILKVSLLIVPLSFGRDVLWGLIQYADVATRWTSLEIPISIWDTPWLARQRQAWVVSCVHQPDLIEPPHCCIQYCLTLVRVATTSDCTYVVYIYINYLGRRWIVCLGSTGRAIWAPYISLESTHTYGCGWKRLALVVVSDIKIPLYCLFTRGGPCWFCVYLWNMYDGRITHELPFRGLTDYDVEDEYIPTKRKILTLLDNPKFEKFLKTTFW